MRIHFLSPRGLYQTVLLFSWFGLLSCRAGDPYPEILTIGQVQGELGPDMEAASLDSPFLGETVKVRGVLHQVLRWRTSSGEFVHAVLLQNTPEHSDRNPDTSDGLFLYTGAYPSLPLEGEGEYTARVGDRVTVKGQVNERYGQTELSDAVVLEVERGDFLDELKVARLSTLPDSRRERDRVLETFEGMRISVPSGVVTVSGTHPNNRNGDLNLWAVLPSHPVASRSDPATRRLFRPAHPLSREGSGGVPEHGDHLVIGHLGAREVVAATDSAAMPMVYAGSTITEALTGGMVYSWGEYVFQPDELPMIDDAGPAASSLPEERAAEDALRIAAYNVENLYDFVNDPFDGCDFAGDEGCPDVRKPFNYVPVSDERYHQRLDAIAEQIVAQLQSPDLLLIQEVEDQDIGVLTENGVVYGNDNHADGEIDALQELAIRIVAKGGPVYRTAIDRDGADYRGITCAWMYNPETVQLSESQDLHPLLRENPDLPEAVSWLPLSEEGSNPKAFNAEFGGVDSGASLTQVFSRPVQLMQVSRRSDGRTLYLFNNHFSSGPGRRVERRTQQARLNALLASTLMETDPEAWVIVGGDLNVFPRPDDPLDPPSDQLGPLYRAGLFNVYDRVVQERPAEAYSYIYKGVVNTLDHFFLSPTAKQALSYAGYLKLNASAPEAFSWETPRRASDHDPVMIELK
jgi:predicted extracellular nuclease